MRDYIGAKANSYAKWYVPAEHVQAFVAQGGRLLRPVAEAPKMRRLAPLAAVMRERPVSDAWPEREKGKNPVFDTTEQPLPPAPAQRAVLKGSKK